MPSVQHVAKYCLSQLDQLTPDGQDVLLIAVSWPSAWSQNAHPASVSWLVGGLPPARHGAGRVPVRPHIAQSWPLHTEELQSETRRAVLDLAARVVETVTRTAS